MTALCGTASATDLVPGDPDQVEWLAREYGRYAGGACDAARALRRIDTGEWVGPAGDAFRHAIGEVPDKLDRGQAAFARAATALAEYARTLRAAQSDAGVAIRRQADGEAATARWRQLPEDERSAYDPGGDDRLAAEHILTAARMHLDDVARRTAAVLDDARAHAPHEPGLLSKAVHAVGSFFAGAVEATWGLVEFGFKLSPTYALIDPEGFVDNITDLGKGIAYGVAHPKELGKAMLDWDTWAHDPARALGHLVPDLLLALATAGAGEAGAAAGRVAKGAEVAEDLAEGGMRATRGIRAAARAAELTEEEAALLERRFLTPTEDVLRWQGEPPYSGVDRWSDRILKPGEKFSVGHPGQGRFAATEEAVEQVGTDAVAYNEGLQVASFESEVDGVARYRPQLKNYEVTRPMPVGESIAEANMQFGPGGLSQYFLPDDLASLLDEGFIRHVGTTEMTNLESRIGPKGLPLLEPRPAASAAIAGDETLAVSGALRREACG